MEERRQRTEGESWLRQQYSQYKTCVLQITCSTMPILINEPQKIIIFLRLAVLLREKMMFA